MLKTYDSTETALVKVMNDILLALDHGKVSILTLLDLSAAFDTIDHTLLLNRLNKHYGISGTALTWFQSYLTGRKQTVAVDGYRSGSAEVAFGVPQGSVLGPVLFIMYTKPLSNLIETCSIASQSFVDDTQLHDSFAPDRALAASQNIEKCIIKVKTWMTENKLKLNDDKTESLLIKSSRALCTVPLPAALKVGDCDVTFSAYARNLGFTVSDDMSLDKHVTNVCRSAFLEIRRISSIRKFLTLDATRTLMCAFVLSKLDYCNALLSECPLYITNKLQKVQNAAARLVLKARKSDHVKPLLRTLHWLPIQARIDYKLCTLCHSFFLSDCSCLFIRYVECIHSLKTASLFQRFSDASHSSCQN